MFEHGSRGALKIEGIDLHALARRHGTPLHVYSSPAIRARIAQLRAALQGLDAHICYAVKANPGLAVLALMAEAGLGADIVSAGELQRALHAGIEAHRIVFSGVGKTAAEMREALDAGIWKFNVESHDELLTLQHVARERRVIAHGAVRVNPDVDAGTHEKISTGKAQNKFGVSIDDARLWFAEAAKLPNVRLDGLHVHIGSQVTSAAAIGLTFERMAALWRELAAAGHVIDSIDLGGGLGVCYRRGHDAPLPVEEYAQLIRAALHDFRGRIVLEPGRWLVAEAGALLTRVIRVKPGDSRRFLIVDAAMNDLLRPSLYDAWHEIVAVDTMPRPTAVYDVVGPVCESSDIFARERTLPQSVGGDLMAIASTGAYGMSMASTYNSRPLAAELMLDAGRVAVARTRQTFDEMIAGESSRPELETFA
jgi:diaminopimelate decarboxylase